MLPGGEVVWRNMTPQDVEAKTWSSSDSGKSQDDTQRPIQKRPKRDRKVTKYRHRQDWVYDVEKQRCRVSKMWRKMGEGQDDGQLHSHKKEWSKALRSDVCYVAGYALTRMDRSMKGTLSITLSWWRILR